MSLSALDKACAVNYAVVNHAVAALNELDARFSAMRRTVNLLRGSAELAGQLAFPPIPLPPVSSVDIATYNTIRTVCPMLNLPLLDENFILGLPGISQLQKLRSALIGAYSGLLSEIENSALSIIDQLQLQLDLLAAEALAIARPVIALIDCICQGSAAIQDAVEAHRARETYLAWTSDTKPTLIDENLAAQRSQMNEVKNSLKRALL